MKKEYSKLAKFYDFLHHKKDYKQEVEFFTKIINKNKQVKGKKLLDLACGTGEHIKYFKKYFECEGLDINEEMINIAKEKNPESTFYVTNMTTFNFNKKYDVITLLFNSIGYLNKNELKQLFKQANNHLNKGGIFLIETIFLKDKLKSIKNHERDYSDNKFNIRRILNLSVLEDFAILSAKYFLNSKLIDEDKQKIILLKENELKSLFKLNNFSIKKLTYEPTGSTIFIGIKNNHII